MKTKFLFPYQFKKVGILFFVPSIVLVIDLLINSREPNFLNLSVFAMVDIPFMQDTTTFGWVVNNVYNEIVGLGLLVGLLFIAFSRLRTEDEYIVQIRLESLLWACYMNFFILFIAIVFVFDLAFLYVLYLNMFSILVFFIAKFYWTIYKTNKQVDEE